MPAAPPPTTSNRRSVLSRARARQVSQVWRNWSTGFRLAACSAAPGAPARVNAGRARYQKARAGEAGHVLEVDVDGRVRVVAGEQSREHSRVRGQAVGAHERELEARHRRSPEPAQHLDVGVASPDEHEALHCARCKMSPNQAVTDSPVSSVSVMTVTPAIAGGSSPNARR